MNDLQDDIDQQEAQERRKAVEQLAEYVEGRQIETFGKAQKDKAGNVLKAWFQLRPDEELVDGERAPPIRAYMQKRRESDVYEIASMPDELVLALHKANVLVVNAAMVKVLPRGRLADDVKKYITPGGESYSLKVEERDG